MEKRPRTPKTAEQTQSSSIREFLLFDEVFGTKEPVRMRSIGSLSELKQDLYKDTPDPHPRAEQLITVLSKLRSAAKIGKGEIERRPHILVAGGFVRDVLMGKAPKDMDLVTNMGTEELLKKLPSVFSDDPALKNYHVNETGKQFNVLRIILPEDDSHPREEYEVASLRRDSGESDGRRPDQVFAEKRPGIDAMRRDLTVNALFYNPRTGSVIDYVGGLTDIDEKRLRFVGNPRERIQEDYLRALRYIRFLFRTGFEVDQQAKQIIQDMAPVVAASQPAERIVQELHAMFKFPPHGNVVEELEQFGILKELLPEITQLKECPQGPPYHMEGNAYEHTIDVLNNLPKEASKELVWAAILHDVAKPETRTEEPDPQFGTRVRFLGHEEQGVVKARTILNRFKLSADETQKILWLIEHHLAIFEFPEMRESKARALAENPYFPELIELGFADAKASKPAPGANIPKPEELFANVRERFGKIQAFIEEHKGVLAVVQEAINGRVIIAAYQEIHAKKISGRDIGALKGRIQERVRDEQVTSPERAVEILREEVGAYQIN